MAVDKIHTIRSRYAATLLTQFFQLAASAVNAAIVPRALGPIAYGNYSFLMSMATTIRGFTNAGTSQAFFTESAKTRRSGSLTKLYGLFLLLEWVVLAGFCAAAHYFGFQRLVWPGQHFDQILLVSSVEWIIYVSLALKQLGDSKGLTILTQMIVGVGSFVNSAGVVWLAWTGRLHFYSFTGYLLVSTTLLVLALSYFLLRRHRELCWDGAMRPDARKHVRYWVHYASPMIVYTLWGTAVGGLDSYILQRYYGAQEQAYYALALRWASLALTFTSAALSIYWREITVAFNSHGREKAADIFAKFDRSLIFLTLILAVWLRFNAGLLVGTLTTVEFRHAIVPLMIMAFYPVQQTYGQINSVTMLATDRTRQYRNYGMFWSIPGLLLTYFVLAPRGGRLPGLELGATGIALKTVLFGLISIQAYEVANARFLKLSYWSIFFTKLKMFVMLYGTGLAAFKGVALFLVNTGSVHPWVAMAAGSLAYGAGILLFALIKPGWIGLRESDREMLQLFMKQYMSKRPKPLTTIEPQ